MSVRDAILNGRSTLAGCSQARLDRLEARAGALWAYYHQVREKDREASGASRRKKKPAKK